MKEIQNEWGNKYIKSSDLNMKGLKEDVPVEIWKRKVAYLCQRLEVRLGHHAMIGNNCFHWVVFLKEAVGFWLWRMKGRISNVPC